MHHAHLVHVKNGYAILLLLHGKTEEEQSLCEKSRLFFHCSKGASECVMVPPTVMMVVANHVRHHRTALMVISFVMIASRLLHTATLTEGSVIGLSLSRTYTYRPLPTHFILTLIFFSGDHYAYTLEIAS